MGWNPVDPSGGGVSPGGDGDMKKSTYDTDNNGVVDKVDTVPTETYADNEMLKYDATTDKVIPSGDTNTDTTVDFGSKDVKCKSTIVESGSVNVGPGLKLSDDGGDLQLTSNVTGNEFIALDSRLTAGGSFRPTWASRAVREINVAIQPDFSQTQNVSSASYTTTLDSAVDKLYLKSGANHTNFRFSIVSDATGEVIRYYPSRFGFENGVGDTIGTGDVSFEFNAIRVPENQTVTINLFADEPIILNTDGLGNPYFAVDRQIVTEENVVTVENETMDRFGAERSTQVSSGLAVSPDGALGVATSFTVSAGSIDFFDVAYSLDRINAFVVDFVQTPFAPIYSTPNLNYVIAKNDGNIEIRPFPPSNIQRRTECLISIVVFDGSVITDIVPVKFTYRQVGNQLVDFMNAVGNLKVNDDGKIEPAVAGGLTLAHTDIEIFGSNINFTEPRDPHHRNYVGQDPITNMNRYLGNGTLQASGLSDIDPSNYNPAGGGTYVALPGGANTTQIIQIWMRVDTGEPIYIPGQTSYNNIASAISDFVNYRPTLPEVVSVGSVKLGSIIVRAGALDLANESDAVFVPTTKFGDVNPLAEPVSDIEPTPTDNSLVYYDLALNKLVDSGIQYATIGAGSNFTVPAEFVKCRYIIEPVGNMTITLPDAYNPPNPNYELEFINSRRAFGGWNEVDRIVTVTWNDGVDDYFVELTPDPLKGDYDYESYTFRFDFNEWRFTYNG